MANLIDSQRSRLEASISNILRPLKKDTARTFANIEGLLAKGVGAVDNAGFGEAFKNVAELAAMGGTTGFIILKMFNIIADYINGKDDGFDSAENDAY